MSERTIQNYRKRADFQAEYEPPPPGDGGKARSPQGRDRDPDRSPGAGHQNLAQECTATEMKHTTAGSYDMNAPNRIRAAKALLDLTAPGAKNPEP